QNPPRSISVAPQAAIQLMEVSDTKSTISPKSKAINSIARPSPSERWTRGPIFFSAYPKPPKIFPLRVKRLTGLRQLYYK
ncbi:hypothetical protein, partial [uncultured Oscillibacter sp.]|uniref:hypothetical protein n=1 Tax=uncultured Oscillibacter sp. TaxID=876091 RepID=UPI002639D421